VPDHPARPLTQKNGKSTNNALRLFFAIWPDREAQQEMAESVQQIGLESLCGGRKTRVENIHLTLVFIGEVDADRVEALLQAASQAEMLGVPRFDLVFDSLRYWRHNQIVYASVGNVPQELMHLVNGLQLAVSCAGFALEDRPYAPHVTLVKRASCRALPELPRPLVWPVKEWVLVKSEQTSGGSVYSPVHRWSLA
jgi:2'-5' RNA ligase